MLEAAHIIIIVAIIFNVLTIAGFLWIKQFTYSEHSSISKSLFSAALGGVFVLYMLMFLILAFILFKLNYYFYAVLCLFAVIMPFIIGNLSTYEKANVYLNIQITVLVLTLILNTAALSVVDKKKILASKPVETSILSVKKPKKKSIIHYLANDITAKIRTCDLILKKISKKQK